MPPIGRLPQVVVPTTEIWHSIDQIPHPRLRAFAKIWDGKRAHRRAPACGDFDPVELRPYLPFIYIYDVVDPEARLRFRLAGTKVVEFCGVGELAGRNFEEFCTAERHAQLRIHHEAVLFDFALHYQASDLAWQGRPFRRYERLLMPLSDDGVRVNMILGLGYAQDQDDIPAPPHPIDAEIHVTDRAYARLVTAERPH